MSVVVFKEEAAKGSTWSRVKVTSTPPIAPTTLSESVTAPLSSIVTYSNLTTTGIGCASANVGALSSNLDEDAKTWLLAVDTRVHWTASLNCAKTVRDILNYPLMSVRVVAVAGLLSLPNCVHVAVIVRGEGITVEPVFNDPEIVVVTKSG